MFADQLAELDVPVTARLVGIQTRKAADGSVEWVATFRGPAPPAAAAPLADEQWTDPAPAGRMPPPPPRLSEVQIGSGRPDEPTDRCDPGSALRALTPVAAPLISPVPGPFPLLPSQPGSTNRVFPLRCSVQKYAWGKFGADSLVAKLAANNDTDIAIDAKTPYAELWMGTHPSGPSMVMLEHPWRIITPLYDWMKLNPAMRAVPSSTGWESADQTGGGAPAAATGHGLPFLLKVLSVRTALSIQAHPNKKLAEQLHNEKPSYYKDDNHKPEMTIAVTPFEALCSFQKINAVLQHLRACPELVGVVGEDAVSKLSAAAETVAPYTPAWPVRPWGRRGAVGKPGTPMPVAELPDGLTMEDAKAARAAHVVPALKMVFRRLMTADQHLVEDQLESLMHRIQSTSAMLLSPVDELAHRLHEQYPKDVGVFCVYLLNYLVLEPGEALFCNANEPHAYLFGDCVECMATSDNVVRAGLTPKFKDVDVLCDMLTYDDGPPFLVHPSVLADSVYRYVTPVPEFLVDRAEISGPSSTVLPPSPFISLILVIEGCGTLEELLPSSSPIRRAASSLSPPTGSENGSSSAHPSATRHGRSPLARRFSSPTVPVPALAGLVHTLRAGSVFMACAGTAVKLRAARGQKLLLFRATERHELHEAV